MLNCVFWYRTAPQVLFSENAALFVPVSEME